MVTDSGGVQEETTVARHPLPHLPHHHGAAGHGRAGTNELVGVDPEALREAAAAHARAPTRPSRRAEIPLWDGKAGPRAAAAIEAFLGAKNGSALARR